MKIISEVVKVSYDSIEEYNDFQNRIEDGWKETNKINSNNGLIVYYKKMSTLVHSNDHNTSL